MKAVILAAGKGERMGEAFGKKPKCLIPILGLSLIERILHILNSLGFKEIIIVLGYKADLIKSKIEIRKFPSLKIIYVYNENWENGNELSLMKASEYIEEDEYFLLLMSDHLYDPKLIKDAAEKLSEKTLALFYDDSLKEEDLQEALKLTVDDNKFIKKLGKELNSTLADCGVMVLRGDIFKYKQEIKDKESLPVLLSEYSIRNNIKAVPIKEYYWQDIDTYKDFIKARRKFLKSLITPKEGLISKKINRYISLKITEFLSNYKIKPNIISLISFILSLVCALLFIYKRAFLGGVFAQLSSIIDGVDGELARAKYLATKYGGYFESILDRYADSLIILGMAYYSLDQANINIVLFVSTMALIGCALSMLSKEKFQSLFGRPYLPDIYDGWTRYLPSNRDGRLFIVFLGGIFNQVFVALIALAILSNFQAIYRLMFSVKRIKV